VLIEEYRRLLEQAGFDAVVITDTGADLNAYAMASQAGGCCGDGQDDSNATCVDLATPLALQSKTTPQPKSVHDGIASVMQAFDANAFAASVRVHALKQVAAQTVNTLPTINVLPISQETNMKTIQVYDKPMCCSTGICGPEVDPVLPQFAADLDWLKGHGHAVERYNLAQQPQAFIENKVIHQLLSTAGTDCLPVVLVNGEIVSQATYPSREELSAWATGAQAKQLLPVARPTGGCCGTSGCC
jgi:hypothetical protein